MTAKIDNRNNSLVFEQPPMIPKKAFIEDSGKSGREGDVHLQQAKLKQANWQSEQIRHKLIGANMATATTTATLTQIPESSKEIAFDGAFVGGGRRVYSADSDFNSVPAMNPKFGARSKQKIIYVNGITTNKNDQAFTMRQIADITGSPIIGIHNSTEGFIEDLAQCSDDKNDIGKNPAVDTLTKTILSELKHHRTVHIMGHSQGGLIVARALFRIETSLYNAARKEGLSREDAQVKATRQMSKINVETFGAASKGYPNGPRYVHYVNNCDNVPLRFGTSEKKKFNIDPGNGAVIRRFRVEFLSLGKLPNLFEKFVAPHSIDFVYLKFRQPFDQARREGGAKFMPGPVNGIVDRPGFIVHLKP